MIIDEERKYALTKYSTIIGKKDVKESDHNLLMLKLKLNWSSMHETINQRKEIFNFKNVEDFDKFRIVTENDDELLQSFDDESDLNQSANKWLELVNKRIRKCFRKIRLGKSFKNKELEALFTKKEKLVTEINQAEKEDLDHVSDLKEEIENTINQISSICASKNKDIVNEYLGKMQDTIEGFSQIKTYNLKKRLCPKNTLDPPSAKRDHAGKLVSDPHELESLYLKTYRERLTPNEVPET